MPASSRSSGSQNLVACSAVSSNRASSSSSARRSGFVSLMFAPLVPLHRSEYASRSSNGRGVGSAGANRGAARALVLTESIHDLGGEQVRVLEAEGSEHGSESWCWAAQLPELAESRIDPCERRLDRRGRVRSPLSRIDLQEEKRGDRTVVGDVLAGV